jgi:hypothetical protein
MLAAVREVGKRKKKGLKVNKLVIANKHGIPISSLRAQLKKSEPLQICARGRKPVLHAVEENLIEYLITRHDGGFATPVGRLGPVVKELALVLASQLPDSDVTKAAILAFQASDGWKANFTKRWEGNLTARRPQLFHPHRAKACREETLRAWASQYIEVLKDLDRLSEGPGSVENTTAKQICNMDESGFASNPNGVGKVFGPLGMRECQNIGSEHGTHVTAVFALKAAVKCSTPFYVLPSQRAMANITLRRMGT